MKRFYLLLFVMAAAFGPLSLAQAQWSGGYRATVNGEGRVRWDGGPDFDVRQVRMDLDRRGPVTVTVYGNRESISLSGRWSDGDKDVPKVRFTRWDGRTAEVEGTMEFSRQDGRLERITVSGRAGRDKVSLNFREKGNGSGGSSDSGRDEDFERLNVRASGSGNLSVGLDRRQINAVRVNLQRGGNARITLYLSGGREESLEGRWTGIGEDIGLRLDNGMGGRLRSARGSVNRRLRTGGLDRLELTGDAGRDRVAISFRAD